MAVTATRPNTVRDTARIRFPRASMIERIRALRPPAPADSQTSPLRSPVSEAITGRSDSARPRVEIRVPDAQQQVNRDRRPAERVEEAGKLTEQGDD